MPTCSPVVFLGGFFLGGRRREKGRGKGGGGLFSADGRKKNLFARAHTRLGGERTSVAVFGEGGFGAKIPFWYGRLMCNGFFACISLRRIG